MICAVAAAHDLRFVCVPAGTRNHFALDLGVDRDDVVGSLDAYGEARQGRIDLSDVNGRVFVNNVSLGVYARIVASDEYRDAKLRNAARMLPELLGPDAKPSGLRVRTPGARSSRNLRSCSSRTTRTACTTSPGSGRARTSIVGCSARRCCSS
jgi:diacylglycerol kinase family enzyme